jgi:hypothetical protein
VLLAAWRLFGLWLPLQGARLALGQRLLELWNSNEPRLQREVHV